MFKRSIVFACVRLWAALPLWGQVAGHESATGGNQYAAFLDVHVVPMDGERILEHQTVLVRDGRIQAVGPAREVPIPVSALKIEGRGCGAGRPGTEGGGLRLHQGVQPAYEGGLRCPRRANESSRADTR